MNCPKCSKPFIEVRKYTDGGLLYIHAAKLVLSGKVCEITDSCYINTTIKQEARK
jgi:hypothetical protein